MRRAANGPRRVLKCNSPSLLLQLEKVLTSINRGMDFSAYAVAGMVPTIYFRLVFVRGNDRTVAPTCS